MGQEYELKFQATAAIQGQIRASLGDVWHACSMATTYYDSPDGQLSAHYENTVVISDGEPEMLTL